MKFLQKPLALFLCVIMAAAALALSVNAAPNAWSYDFENEPVGEDLKDVTEGGKNVITVTPRYGKITVESFGTSQAAKFAYCDVQFPSKNRDSYIDLIKGGVSTFGVAKQYVFEYRLYFDEIGESNSWQLLASREKGSSTQIQYAGYFKGTADGKAQLWIEGTDHAVATFAADTWLNVAVCIDKVNNRFSVYVNGVCYALDTPYTISDPSAPETERIRTGWDAVTKLPDGTVSNAIAYLDDIQVYNATVPRYVAVTGITLKGATTLHPGDTEQLSASVLPTSATNKEITYTSSDTSIVTVTASGLITAVAKGTADITATAEEGGFSAVCHVTVTTLPKPDAPDVSTLSAVSPSGEGRSDGKIVGTTSLMECSMTPDFAVSIPCGDGETTGLRAGIYFVRIQAANNAPASDAVQIMIVDPEPQIMPLPAMARLSFDTNGGTKIGSIFGIPGYTVKLIKYAPEREGFTFAGWYLDQALTQAAPSKLKMGARSITLYAAWKEIRAEEASDTPRPSSIIDYDFENRTDGISFSNIANAKDASIYDAFVSPKQGEFTVTKLGSTKTLKLSHSGLSNTKSSMDSFIDFCSGAGIKDVSAFGLTQQYVMSYRIYFEEIGISNHWNLLTSREKTPATQLQCVGHLNGTESGKVELVLTGVSGVAATFDRETWLDIAICMDTDKNTFCVYVNGVCYGENLPYTVADTSAVYSERIRTGWDNATEVNGTLTSAIAYLDDILIYNGTAPFQP